MDGGPHNINILEQRQQQPPTTTTLEVGASNVIQASGRESQPVIPDDGYEWKKYGRKFVNAIGKIRSYYRCRRANCNAKKTVEWPPENPSDVQIKYPARHSHSPTDESNSSWQQEEAARRNAYDLYNQVFGRPQVFDFEP